MKRMKLVIVVVLLLPLIIACVVTLDSRQIIDLLVGEVVKTLQANPPVIQQPALENPVLANSAPALNLPLGQVQQQPQPVLPTSTQLPCYYALLVGENLPDGAAVQGGTAFTKTWTLRNTGSCTWNPNYQLVFSGGDLMNAPSAVRINATVAPGGQVTIPVAFRAPSTGGIFNSYWKMRADNGVLFAQVYLKINVPTPTATSRSSATATPAFAVTDVELSAIQNDISVTCGQTDSFTTTAIITANGPGVVSYHWEMDTMGDSQVSPPQTVTFDRAGTRTVQYSWTTTTISWGDFNYYFLKSLPAPANSYHSFIEMQCN